MKTFIKKRIGSTELLWKITKTLDHELELGHSYRKASTGFALAALIA